MASVARFSQKEMLWPSYGKGPDYFPLKTVFFPVSVFLLLFGMKFGIELENYHDQYDSFK